MDAAQRYLLDINLIQSLRNPRSPRDARSRIHQKTRLAPQLCLHQVTTIRALLAKPTQAKSSTLSIRAAMSASRVRSAFPTSAVAQPL